MPQYKLGNNIYEEKNVIEFAKKSNLSVPEYIAKYKGKLKKVDVDTSKKSSSEDINKTIISIANNVSRYDAEVNKELVNTFYEGPLKNMKRPKQIVTKKAPTFVEGPFGLKGRSVYADQEQQLPEFVNSLEIDQENYFGKLKYNQYKTYQETQVFDLSTVSEEDIMIAIDNVKQRKKKDFITTLPKSAQKKALKDFEDGNYDMLIDLKTDKNTGSLNVNGNITNDEGTVNYNLDIIPLVDPSTSGPSKEDFDIAKAKDKESTSDFVYKYDVKTRESAAVQIAELRAKGKNFEANMLEMSVGGKSNVKKRKNVVDIQQGGGAKNDYFTKLWETSTTTVELAQANIKTNNASYKDFMSKTTASAIAVKEKAESLDKSDPNYNQKIQSYINEVNALVDLQANATNAINDQVDQYTTLLNDYEKIAINTSNYNEVAKSLMLDYDFSSRASLSLEVGALEAISAITGLVAISEKAFEDILDVDKKDYSEKELLQTKYFRHANQRMLDYTESVKQYQESSLPVSYRWEDMSADNFAENLSEIVANNSFSMLSAISYGGILRYGKSIMTTPQATKLLGNVFFAVEKGGYDSRQDIARKNAKKNIAFAEKMLAVEDITPENLITYQNQKDDALRVLTQGEYEKAFAGIAYGSIAKYAEKFGTMRYMRNFAAANKSTGNLLTRTMKGSYNIAFNAATEYVEEAGTLAGHNFVDNVGGANVSIFKGLDADFNVNVLVSTLGIQGPSVARNVTMAIYDIGTTRNKKIANRKRGAKIVELQKEFESIKDKSGFAANSQRADLRNEINKLIEEASLSFTFDMAEIAQLGDQDLRELFELDRQLKAQDQDAAAYGQQMASENAPEFYQRKLDEVKEKKKRIIEQMDALKEKPYRKNLEYFRSIVGADAGASSAFYYSYYQNTKELATAMGQKYNVFEDEASMVEFLKQEVEKSTIEQGEADGLIEKFKDTDFTYGASGSESAVGIIIREDNVVKNINAAKNDFEKSFVAYTLFHEMQHQNDKSIGLLKNGQITEENIQAVKSLEQFIEDQYKNNSRFTKDVYNSFKKRLNSYKSQGKNLTEMMTLLSELQNYGAIEENTSLEVSLRVLFNKAAKSYFGANANLFRFRDGKDVAAYVANFRKGLRNYVAAGTVPEQEQEGVQASEGVSPLAAINNLLPENITTNKDYQDFLQDPRRFKALYEATFDNGVISNYVKSRSIGDEYNIAIESVRDRLINFKPEAKRADGKAVGKEGFGEFIFANTRFGKLDAKKALAIEAEKKTKSLDTKEAREVVDEDTKTTKKEDTFVQKINVLGFATVGKVVDKIKSLVKVKPGDTFKQIIKNYAGRVGELIFDMPAKKIMEGGANLTAVTKYKEGMPVPAEGQNIQKFFSAGNNMERFIKILPPTNVTSKTADIDKVGENIEVQRDAYGLAIGLKGLPLNYFYKKTGKRSQGLTSQTAVFELKDEFKNPTPETIEKVKQDLGITAKGQENVYSRDIGQLLKGVAKVYSINAALSAAQRVQQAKTEVAPAAKKPAIKKQTASITAAQSKAAFSEGVAKNVDNMHKGVILTTFEGDLNRINKITNTFIKEDIFKHGSQTEIDDYFEAFETTILGNLPENMFGANPASVFSQMKKSKRVLPNSGKDEITLKDGRTISVNDYFDEKRNILKKKIQDGNVTFGQPFKGKGNEYVYGKSYADMYAIDPTTKKPFKSDDPRYAKAVEKAFYDGTREKYNAIHASMHKQFMARVAASIRDNNQNVKVWGNYFSFVGQDAKHAWRMGAEWVLFSKNPIGTEGKLYEWEHAMMATRSYLYLLETALTKVDGKYLDFNLAYEQVMENYKLIALDNYEDKVKLGGSGRQKTMGKDWQFLVNSWLDRYFHPEVAAIKGKNGFGINPKNLIGEGKKTAAEIYNININGDVQALNTDINQKQNFSEGVKKARVYDKNTKARGMSAFDFDETVGVSQNYVIATKDGETKRIASDRWPFVGDDLLQQGWKMDFTDFNRVTDGKPGPLMQKMKNQIKKFGPKNVFILTARAPESQQAIHEYLKSEGINIPLENITGLGNSTGEAKALWMLNKFAEGYNDMYFVDDALPNVKAVKNVLEQLDIKSKVVQAKINFSEGLDKNFNDILETLTGIESKKRFDFIKARKRGAGKGKFRLFIPPSHEDFVGLLYNFIGKGREGDAHREFFEEALVRPLNRANREYDTARQSVATDYKNLNKQMPEVKKMFNKKTPDGDFVYQDAIRIYLWDKHGYDIPGLSPIDQKNLVELVNSDPNLKSYAETINIISKQETYVDPTDGWDSGDIRMDLDDATGRIGRAQFFEEFNKNADVIFSKENLNKIEAGYGKGVREALEDMLYRIKTGRNKPSGQGKMVNDLMNWVNGSVGSVMFFNMRSALLQQMSIVNYINFADNNIYAAAKAFANQKQYWADWAFIFNSDMLKQRRGGIQTDINGAELAAEMRKSKNPHRFLISKLLELGFLPTQIGDNIAIATGGATYYRNRINTYLKQGLSKTEAETKAFTDFQDITQSTQQSARPDMVSQQQASVIGKVILNFQNVTSQFNRLAKKAFLDIKNRRITKPNTTQMQSDISNAARITYYLAIQNLIFYTLQTAMFAMLFDDDEEDVNNLFLKKRERLINGSIDSVLRGTGMFGAILSTLKNTAIAYARQRDVNYNPDESAVLVEALNFSPVLGIKARKVVNAEKTLNYNKKVIKEMSDFDIDNPQWSAVTNYIEAGTNMPLNRLYNKTQNVRQTLNNEHAAWERTLMFLGWSQYNLNLTNKKMDAIKAKSKKKKRKRKILR